jgi:S-adenosylmethionine-diacylglycerol 3-amino-3-carboxypropyl transferase
MDDRFLRLHAEEPMLNPNMVVSVPAWVERAAVLPIAFAQVREDPIVDLAAVKMLGPGTRVMMVASGGCTAAFLAARAQLSHLHLVDLNAAQLGLTRLKLHWLANTTQKERSELLGHTTMPVDLRIEAVMRSCRTLGIKSRIFGPIECFANGLDYSGRYEKLFAALQERLSEFADNIKILLSLSDLKAQRNLLSRRGLGVAIDDAIAIVMRKNNLVRLFGEAATANRRQSFARHFIERTRWAISHLPAASNPWLAQVLIGSYQHSKAPWLSAKPPAHLPKFSFYQSDLTSAIDRVRGPLDMIHCSNVLDWLTPGQAATLLSRCLKKLRPGGLIIIRRLNSMLDIPACEPRFQWLAADRLQRQDRSFFYRSLHLGRK